MDPAEGYANKVKFKEECDCKYDCLSGRFCEVPVQCSCINQCSGHGHCRGGFCQVTFVLSLIMIPGYRHLICTRKEINKNHVHGNICEHNYIWSVYKGFCCKLKLFMHGRGFALLSFSLFTLAKTTAQN